MLLNLSGIKKMKRLLFIAGFLIITLINFNCGVNDGNEKLYRRQITVESNLSDFQFGNIHFDSATVYPYVLDDFTIPNFPLSSSILTIYPVADTGYIKFKIFGGEGNSKPIALSLKNFLVITTPIDTTGIFFQDYSAKTF